MKISIKEYQGLSLCIFIYTVFQKKVHPYDVHDNYVK